ncbi:hypothetical protein CALCODRAFT_492288 [Calocera cornea HHB12733]|uniref:Vacuolar import and degradation protein 21 n=1 Tax=Calocera cornea HHB12733 TaxID=1353952 RepID=A0A165IFR8_9BASI|nr:hypothetical protein CALCODRAFT_492288 [Calocera cornea HHB12733]
MNTRRSRYRDDAAKQQQELERRRNAMAEECERSRTAVIEEGTQEMLELFDLLSNKPGELVGRGESKEVPDRDTFVGRWAEGEVSVTSLSVELPPTPLPVVPETGEVHEPTPELSPKTASSLHLSPSPAPQTHGQKIHAPVHEDVDVLMEEDAPSPSRATISRKTSRQPSAAPASIKATSSGLGLSPTSSDSEPLTEPPTSPRQEGTTAAASVPHAAMSDADRQKGSEDFYDLSSWNYSNLPPLEGDAPEKQDQYAACWSVPEDSWFSSAHPMDQPLSTAYTDSLGNLARSVALNGSGGPQVGKKRKRHRKEKEGVRGEFSYLAASIGANPVHKHVSHPAKCMTTRDWMVVYREFTFLQAVAEIDELQQQGLWSLRQPKRQLGPPVRKAHWDYLLEEMQWMRTDFVEEKQWKAALTYEICLCIKEWWAADVEGKRAMQAGWRRQKFRQATEEEDQQMYDRDSEGRDREDRRQRHGSGGKTRGEDEEVDADAEVEGDGDSEEDMLPSPVKRRRTSSVPAHRRRQASVKEEEEDDHGADTHHETMEQENVEEEVEEHEEAEEDRQNEEETDADGEEDAEVEAAEDDADGEVDADAEADADADGDAEADAEGDSEEVEQAARIDGDAETTAEGEGEQQGEENVDGDGDEDMDAEGEEDAEGTDEEGADETDGGPTAERKAEENAPMDTDAEGDEDADGDEDDDGDADADEDADGETEAATGSQRVSQPPEPQLPLEEEVQKTPIQQEEQEAPRSVPSMTGGKPKPVNGIVSTPEAQRHRSPTDVSPAVRTEPDIKRLGSVEMAHLITAGPVLASPGKESPTSPAGPLKDSARAENMFLLLPETPPVDVQTLRLSVLELPPIDTIFDPQEVTGKDDYDTLLELFPDLQVYDLSEPVQAVPSAKERKPEPLPGLPLLMGVKPVLVSTLRPTNQNWEGEHEDWELLLDEPREVGKPGVLPMFSGRKQGAPPAPPLPEPHDPAGRLKALHWNNEDDAILFTCVSRFGENWDLVADAFNTKRNTIKVDWRTPWDCAKRWVSIRPKEGPAAKDIDRARRMDNLAPHPYYQRQDGTKKKDRQAALREVVRKSIKKREQSGPKYSTSKKINLTAHNTHGTLEKNVPSPYELSKQKFDKENMLRLERFALNQGNQAGQRMMARVPGMPVPPGAAVSQQPVPHGPNGQPLTNAHLAIMQQQQRLQAQALQVAQASQAAQGNQAAQGAQATAAAAQANAAAMQRYAASPQGQAAMMQAHAAAARAQQAGVNISRAHQAAAAAGGNAGGVSYPGVPPNASPPSGPLQHSQFQAALAHLKAGNQLNNETLRALSQQPHGAEIIRMLYQQAGYQPHAPQQGSSASPPQPHASPTIPPS